MRNELLSGCLNPFSHRETHVDRLSHTHTYRHTQIHAHTQRKISIRQINTNGRHTSISQYICKSLIQTHTSTQTVSAESAESHTHTNSRRRSQTYLSSRLAGWSRIASLSLLSLPNITHRSELSFLSHSLQKH